MQSKSFTASTIWRLSKIGDRVREEAEGYEKARTERIKRSGAKLLKEKIEGSEEGAERAWWKFNSPEDEEKINEEIEGMLEEETSLELNQCSLKDLLCPELTPWVLMNLLWMVKEPTEEEFELLDQLKARTEEPESSGDKKASKKKALVED